MVIELHETPTHANQDEYVRGMYHSKQPNTNFSLILTLCTEHNLVF